jgi:type II secretory pathway pseudopilin PulG
MKPVALFPRYRRRNQREVFAKTPLVLARLQGKPSKNPMAKALSQILQVALKIIDAARTSNGHLTKLHATPSDDVSSILGDTLPPSNYATGTRNEELPINV